MSTRARKQRPASASRGGRRAKSSGSILGRCVRRSVRAAAVGSNAGGRDDQLRVVGCRSQKPGRDGKDFATAFAEAALRSGARHEAYDIVCDVRALLAFASSNLAIGSEPTETIRYVAGRLTRAGRALESLDRLGQVAPGPEGDQPSGPGVAATPKRGA